MRSIEDALEVLNALNSQGRIEYAAYSELYDTIAMIETEPVRHGHWIMPNKEKTDRPLPECSHCGWYVDKGGVLDFSYCPNCGARMEEVKKNDSI